MKTTNKLSKNLTLGIGISMIIIWGSFISCEKEDLQAINASKNSKSSQEKLNSITTPSWQICSPIVKKTLYIDGKTKVGSVEIYNDTKFLYVNALADINYGFGEAHVYAGDLKDVPKNRLGRIDYKGFNNVKFPLHFVNNHRFKIQLSDIKTNVTLSIMIQISPEYTGGEIRNAWAFGGVIEDRNDAKLFEFRTIKCSTDTDPVPERN